MGHVLSLSSWDSALLPAGPEGRGLDLILPLAGPPPPWVERRSSLTRQFWKENLEALITWYLKDAGVTLSGVLLGQRTVIFLYASPGRWKFLDVLWWFPEGENIGTKKRLRS